MDNVMGKYKAAKQRDTLLTLQATIVSQQDICNKLVVTLLMHEHEDIEYTQLCTDIRIHTKRLEEYYRQLRYHMGIMQGVENDTLTALIQSDMWERYEQGK